ncbi:GntR family transcriptional regulator [Amycolatopsis pithecellobii]|uniref:FCD domain-containing protein n=1 Tax=Amycolatopsis pithecellobii TaxID=664692 RepID=A0A6N7Z6D7_9PSEU|nr:GntR family transcriptional regulator [Amycolatopsis pithecellobii]MTD55116.1 FCD domain-containing protein [Amycolatopsis pithecellobii]
MTDENGTPAPGAEKTGIGNTSRRIADAMRAAILSGELPPGSRIRQEELAARYGASRIPVRSALSILEADGLVKLVANSGAWVSQFDLSECEEFYRIREQIEPLLLRASLPGLAAEIFDQMESLAEQMASTDSAEEFLRLDREFHSLSYSGAKTVVLDEIVQRMWNMTHHYRLMFTRVFLEQGDTIVHDEHRMLVRALRERDADQAALVATGHIRRTRLQLARHPELFTVHHSP